MLVAVEIENFKGVGSRTRVDLKPLTLLFGPNSAGKSSVLHSLHYAREILEHRNSDPDTTEVGGPFVDLGGFESLVHLREKEERDVVIRFCVDPQGNDIPERTREPHRWVELRDYNNELYKQVQEFCVELTIGWHDRLERSTVTGFALEVNGESVGELRVAADGQRVDLCGLNFSHPLLRYNWNRVVGNSRSEETDEAIQEFYDDLAEFDRFECPEMHSSAVPLWDDALWLDFDGVEVVEPYRGGSLIYRLTAFFAGLGGMLRSELASLRYLGPIRETPPRGYSAPLTPDISRWSTGLAAWDRLIGADDTFVLQVNRWLDRIGSGSAVRIEEYKELPLESFLMASLRSRALIDDAEAISEALNRLPTHRRVVVVDLERQLPVAPTDVGIGISQVVPVIVAATDSDGEASPRVIAIEQPELHVHPSVQVELGDLFAWRATARSGICILETHSEHLMLRLLRRIQETHRGEVEPGRPRLAANQLSVLFVEQEEGEVRVTPLAISDRGEFVDRWPQGFFEERVKELF